MAFQYKPFPAFRELPLRRTSLKDVAPKITAQRSAASRKWAAPACTSGDVRTHLAATKIQLAAALYLLARRRQLYNYSCPSLLRANHNLGSKAYTCRSVLEADRRRREAAATLTRQILDWLYKPPKGPMITAGFRVCEQLLDHDLLVDDVVPPPRETRAQVRAVFDHSFRAISWLNFGFWDSLLREQRISPELFKTITDMVREGNEH